ncbi:MAG: hypothetical protein OEX82_07910 [Nitrosomonas sp.]|nr:hypothetical protein [Nitrosomonas sp.]
MNSKRTSLVIIMAMFFVLACSKQPITIAPNKVEFVDGRVLHAGAPLFDGMGDYHHAVTTNGSTAQRYFNQGLIMSFAFNHAEAVRSFRAAQQLDEACAMCFWGEALALGPNINVTSDGKAVMADEARLKAHAAIQQAVALKAGVSQKERDYIDALATRYNGDIKTPRDALDLAYIEAMRELSQKYPKDDDAAAFFADSLMTIMPWDYWLDEETPKPLTAEVIDILEKIIGRTPEHPLALHLYIHAVEASSTPERAEAAADRLLNLVPSAGHLVHMPSHIYWRVGRYQDASEANIKAVAVDEAYIAACNVQGFYPAAYYPHNIHFIWASTSMEGRSQIAIETAQKIAANVSYEMIEQFPRIESFKTIPMLALTNFGRWEEVLDVPQPPDHLTFSNAIWHYVRATAFARKGDIASMQAEYEKLVPLRHTSGVKHLDTIAYPASMLLNIADELVQGEIAWLEGKQKNAIDNFKKAVIIQDELPYTEPPFWYYPTRLTLGKALLESGLALEAEQVYRQNLKNYPKNGWAMFGLIQSIEKQNKNANEVREAFEAAWKNADISLTASRF